MRRNFASEYVSKTVAIICPNIMSSTKKRKKKQKIFLIVDVIVSKSAMEEKIYSAAHFILHVIWRNDINRNRSNRLKDGMKYNFRMTVYDG